MAASRLYYALFLAVVGEMEHRNVQPQKIGRGSASSFEERGTKWTNSFVKNNGGLAGLDLRQSSLLRSAYQLRIVADYEALDATAIEVLELLRRAQDVLEVLGVMP